MDGRMFFVWIGIWAGIIILAFLSQFIFWADNPIEESVEKILEESYNIDIDFSPDY